MADFKFGVGTYKTAAGYHGTADNATVEYVSKDGKWRYGYTCHDGYTSPAIWDFNGVHTRNHVHNLVAPPPAKVRRPLTLAELPNVRWMFVRSQFGPYAPVIDADFDAGTLFVHGVSYSIGELINMDATYTVDNGVTWKPFYVEE